MLKIFEKLTIQEQELLFKAPVLMSVLASGSDGEVNKQQKADAIKLAHIKTFTALPLLRPYYQEVEKRFREDFETVSKTYYPFDEKKRNELKTEIGKVQQILGKINPVYAEILSKSLERYAAHVKKATHSIFRDFMFPMIILDMKHR
jgi:hypothetical protein